MPKKPIVFLVSTFVMMFNLCICADSVVSSISYDGEVGKDVAVANSLFQSKKYEESLQVLNKLLGKQEKVGDKRFYGVYKMKVKVLQQTNKPNEALQVLSNMKKEYSSDPYLVLTYILEGDIYLSEKEYEKAVQDFDYVIKHAKTPGIIEMSKTGLVLCFMNMGKLEEAIKISEGMKNQFALGILYAGLADSYIKQGEEAKAIQILKDGSEKLRDDAKRLIDFRLMQLLKQQGKNKEADEILTKYLLKLPSAQQEEIKMLLEKIEKMEREKRANQ